MIDSILFASFAFIIILFLVGVYAYFLQARMARLDDACDDAMRLLSIQMNSRWVAMENLARELFKLSPLDGVAQQEAICEKRKSIPDSPEYVEKQGEAIEQVCKGLVAACSGHASMKSSGEYVSLSQRAEDYRSNVSRSMSVYNNAASKLNELLSRWPSRPIARMLGFRSRKTI